MTRFAIPEDELTERFSRSSGPGGQHVNTSDTKVEVRWDLARSPSLSDEMRARLLARLGERLIDGVLVVVASEFRSQWRNRQAARMRLTMLVEEAMRPRKSRRPTRPSRSSQQARLESKRHRSTIKRGRGRVDPRGD